MKKQLFFAAMAAMALASCAKDEMTAQNNGDAIAFNASAGKSSRSEIVTTNTISKFHVWGYTDAGAKLMDVDVEKADGKWSYSPIQYWPNSGTLDFYSVSPATTTVNITDKTIENFEVATAVANQIDLLYALNTGCSKATGTVPVNFRHALSQIVFQVSNTNANMRVVVKSVEVGNIVTGGTFTWPTAATTDPNYSTDVNGTKDTELDASWGEWTLGTTKAVYAAGVTAFDKTGEFSAQALTTAGAGELLLMPQELTAWNPETHPAVANATGVYFLVDCAIYDTTNDEVKLWPVSNATSAKVAIPASSITWKQGKKYVYTFVFGKGGGYNPDPVDPNVPEEVLVPIDFTVTVDEFQIGETGNLDMNIQG